MKKIRDLSDFCTQWPDLRNLVATGQLDEAGMADETRRTIEWLTVLADKVCVVTNEAGPDPHR